MDISVISFTENGKRLSGRVFAGWEPERVFLYTKCTEMSDSEETESAKTTVIQQVEEDTQSWTGAQFAAGRAIVFVGACGIAVRMIAPFVRDKLTDSPVIVMDEMGQFVIPILSGHVGGANALAMRLAGVVGAVPVLTTATDVNQTFAADVFAKQQRLTIQNKEGIARVSSKILAGKMADIVIATDEKALSHGILRLKPKEYTLGIGCRRGKSYAEIRDFVDKRLKMLGITMRDVNAVASIDRKRDEEGIIRLANANRIPFLTFSAEQLNHISGDFTPSEFVNSQVGVDNVCERAAMAAAGDQAKLVLPKTAENGMTLAVAHAPWQLVRETADYIIDKDEIIGNCVTNRK